MIRDVSQHWTDYGDWRTAPLVLAAPDALTWANIPGGYTRLRLELALRSTKVDYEDSFALRFNGDATPGRYAGAMNATMDDRQPLAVGAVTVACHAPYAAANWPAKEGDADNATNTSRLYGWEIPASRAEAGCYGQYQLDVPWYDVPNWRRMLRGWGGHGQFSGTARDRLVDGTPLSWYGSRSAAVFTGYWFMVDPITSITVAAVTGILDVGSRGVLYGVR